MEKEQWEEEFLNLVGCNYNDCPEHGTAQMRAFIRTQISKARQEADQLVEAVHLYNTDAIKALEQARQEGRQEILSNAPKNLEDDIVAIAAYSQGRQEGYEKGKAENTDYSCPNDSCGFCND